LKNEIQGDFVEDIRPLGRQKYEKYYVIMLISAALAAVNVPLGKLPNCLICPIDARGGPHLCGRRRRPGFNLWPNSRLFKWDKDPLLKGKDWLYILAVNTFAIAVPTRCSFMVSLY
jgi:hypothetical protein